MIRNFIRQSQPWTKNVSPLLGRWKRNDYIDRKVDLANIDHCGDRVCGDLYKESNSIIELFDKRWNDEISKDEFKQKLKEYETKENIDSHDNSLYHSSLKNKSSYYMNNYNYSIQSIVEDYNQRWNEKLTIEDYLKHFTRRHRGAC
tara:strand:+ start:1800 stop:2237 length:438 start_codon:yes stop_codon:yes gene_type:complete